MGFKAITRYEHKGFQAIPKQRIGKSYNLAIDVYEICYKATHVPFSRIRQYFTNTLQSCIFALLLT